MVTRKSLKLFCFVVLYSYKVSLEAGSHSIKESTVGDDASGGYCASYQESWFDNERSSVPRVVNSNLTANNLVPLAACEILKKKAAKATKHNSIQAWVNAVESPIAQKAPSVAIDFTSGAQRKELTSALMIPTKVIWMMKQNAIVKKGVNVVSLLLRGA